MEWDENHHRTETPAKDRSDMTVLPIAFYVSEGRLCARLPIAHTEAGSAMITAF
jgi:hypothetical protein